MKVNFEIDLEEMLSDMLSDDYTDIKDAFRSEIIQGIIRKLMPKINENINLLVGQKLEPILLDKVDRKVEAVMSDLIDKGVMLSRNGKCIPITEHIQNLFQGSTGWSSPHNKIESISKKFGDEMKSQYNNYFAMTIVKNLQEQGLLRDDVAKALLAPSKENK